MTVGAVGNEYNLCMQDHRVIMGTATTKPSLQPTNQPRNKQTNKMDTGENSLTEANTMG